MLCSLRNRAKPIAVDTKIQTVITQEIEKKIDQLVPKTEDAGRPHEQRTDLGWALESILSRVERGMTVELRFLPPVELKDDAEVDYTKSLQELERFPIRLHNRRS